MADASAASPFVTDHVEPATVFTDGWQGYHGRGEAEIGTLHSIPASYPAVHRVASLAKRWLLGTHQGSVSPPTWPATW